MTISKKIILVVTLLYSVAVNAQIPFSEGFESGAKPSGWSEVYVSGTEPWRYRNGGHNPDDNNWTIPAWQIDIARNPSSAHSGTYNAIFFKQSLYNESTKLVTKVIDLSQGVQPELSFWLCQVPWTFSGNTNWDILRVYYKNSFAGVWNLLAEYEDAITEWTQFKINLPDQSSTYYIAFEGETKWGFGTCIDDIAIVNKGTQSRYVSELAVNQADYSFIPSGSSNEPILNFRFKVFGNTGTAILNNLSVKSLNTNDTDINTNGVKLYKTLTAQFNTSNPIGTGSNFSNGYITFNDLNLDLPNGYSYIWLTYDVKSSATHGNLLDAMLEYGSIQVNDSLYPKTSESPVGSRVIYETIYRQDFEGVHGWTLGGEFQVGAPQGKGGLLSGYPDPSTAYSGSNVLGTDLTGLGGVLGDYENNISEDQAYKAISPIINALFYKDLKVTYHRYLNIERLDSATVDVSKNNGSTWSKLWYNNNYFTDQLWFKTFHDVPSSISRSNQLKFMFKLGSTDGSYTYSGWNVDDFIVTGDYITKDVGVVEWIYPKSGCGNSATDSVVVKLANLGAAASPSSFPIQYSFDNGTTWVTNFVTQSIAPGDTIEYTFPTKVNLSSPGVRNVKARTKLTGDEDASNDGISTQVYLVPTYSLPYTEQFESNDGYWRSFGTSLWQWGLATKPSMSGSPKSWVTSLAQNYGDALAGKTDTLYSDDFEMNKGWTLTGEFEIDTIIFVSDTIPTYAFSGLSCLGTDLNRLGAHKGMYENSVSWTATSPNIDITGYTTLKLDFYRWFKIMAGDSANIQVSNNGTSWTTLWSNGLAETTDDSWIETFLDIPDSLANGSTLKIRFSIITNSDNVVAEGINIENLIVTGKQFSTSFAYLQSPCFNFSGVTMPVIDLSVFNHTEAGVDGSSLYYSTNNGSTWDIVSNSDTHDSYWNWYTDSLVTSIGGDGWNGLDDQLRRTRHILPSALANQSRVIFRVGFKSDKANNDFGGTAIDNFKLYEAPFDIGVESVLSPTTTCYLSDQQEVKLKIKNYGVRDMKIDDSVIVAINIQHPMITDNKTDKIVLTSALNAGISMEYPISKKFDMSISGDYDITAYTDIETESLFYSPTPNDTAIATVTSQKPYVELGEDIYTWDPTAIILDATTSDVTYQWEAPKGNIIGIGPTYTILDSDGGKYYVTLENTSLPACPITDSITVHRLIRDVGIPSFDSPITSCELSDKTPFRVYIKNFGTDTLTNGDEINLSYIFSVDPQVDSTWVMDQTILPGDSLVFTFNDSLNMQSTGAYNLKAWATTLSDEDAGNDTTDLTINVWGYPTFCLKDAMGESKDTVEDYNISYTLDAGVWNAYLWRNDSSTNQTYDMTTTGWGVVTVFDNHSCPATDSLFVNLKFSDVGVESVISPITACEVNGTIYPQILIKNMGTDTLTDGTEINLKYYLNTSLEESTLLTLDSDLLPDSTKKVIFTAGVDISAVGSYNFDFVASTLADSKPENDSIRHSVSVYGFPDINLGDSVFTRNANYTIDAGPGHDSYSWSTGATTSQIAVNQTNQYRVVVVDDGICSTFDTLVVTFLRHDYAISQVVNPITSCSTTSPQSIILKYSNVGNDTLKSGAQVTFGYQINDDYFAEENYPLSSNLYPGQFILYTFTDKVDLSLAGNKHIVAYGNYTGDTNSSNNTLVEDIDIKETPVVNLGADRVIRTGQETLDGCEGTGYTYLWQNSSTNRFFIVENTGTYWVSTTAPSGCIDRDTVSITSLRPDYRVSSIISPVSACSLTNAEQIQVEIENVGTDTLFVGQTIYISYEVNNILQQTQSRTMTQKFRPGEKFNHTFSKTYDMQNIGTYNLKAYTTYSMDLNPNNNSLTLPINYWSLPTINLGTDKAICQGSSTILDAGSYSTFLWSTGVTTQTISVSTAGEYWVEVTDSHGCKNRDTIAVSVNNLPIVSHSALNSVCLNASPLTLTGGNPAGGSYSGAGVSGTTFTPSTAGVGTHTLTYQYTDSNGCSNTTTVSITVNPLPVVDLGSDSIITAPITLDAGSGFASYLWKKDNVIISNQTTQMLPVSSTGTYSVTVTNDKGCSGSDEVYISFESLDIRVTQLISPTTHCFNSLEQTVTARLTNNGTRTFTSGESINVSYQVGTSTPVVEAMNFTTNFANGQNLNYTFSEKASISVGTVTIKLKTIISGVDGLTASYSVSTSNPTLDLGPDTFRTELPYILKSGISDVDYQWSTGSTNASITVSEYGSYSLTITDEGGCTAKDSIVIWDPYNSVTAIPGSNAIVKLFPNPVNNELTITIETDKNEAFSIELVNPQGQIVKTLKTEKTLYFNDKINVMGCTSGIYFIRVSNGKGTAVFKVIVQR